MSVYVSDDVTSQMSNLRFGILAKLPPAVPDNLFNRSGNVTVLAMVCRFVWRRKSVSRSKGLI